MKFQRKSSLIVGVPCMVVRLLKRIEMEMGAQGTSDRSEEITAVQMGSGVEASNCLKTVTNDRAVTPIVDQVVDCGFDCRMATMTVRALFKREHENGFTLVGVFVSCGHSEILRGVFVFD